MGQWNLGVINLPILRGSNNATLWWFWRISVWWNELLRDMTSTGDFVAWHYPSTVWKRPWHKAVGVFFAAKRRRDVWCNFWNDFWIDGSRLSLGYGIGCVFLWTPFGIAPPFVAFSSNLVLRLDHQPACHGGVRTPPHGSEPSDCAFGPLENGGCRNHLCLKVLLHSSGVLGLGTWGLGLGDLTRLYFSEAPTNWTAVKTEAWNGCISWS